MTRDEWHAYIESVRLTDNQLGRIIAEWKRVGLAGDDDRAERLALTAAIAGVDDLGSTCDLTWGQAGRVVNRLMRCRHAAELRAEHIVIDDDDQADDDGQGDLEPAPRISLGQALIMAIAWLAFPDHRTTIERMASAADDRLAGLCDLVLDHDDGDAGAGLRELRGAVHAEPF